MWNELKLAFTILTIGVVWTNIDLELGVAKRVTAYGVRHPCSDFHYQKFQSE